MVIRDKDQAVASLADAIWWLKGFGAAASSDHEDTVVQLGASLREVRLWIDSIERGSVRRIGDEKAVVLTYGEFETLLDAFLTKPERAHEALLAASTVKRVLEQYNLERTSALDLDAPF